MTTTQDMSTAQDIEMPYAMLIYTTGEKTLVYEHLDYKFLQGVVDGSFEMMPMSSHEGIMAYVHETGKYYKEPNSKATAFARASLFSGDKLYGNVLFCNAGVDEDGNHPRLTRLQVETLRKLEPTEHRVDNTDWMLFMAENVVVIGF